MTVKCSYCRSLRISGANCPNCGAAYVIPRDPGMGEFQQGRFVVPLVIDNQLGVFAAKNPLSPLSGASGLQGCGLNSLMGRGVQ